MFLDLLQAQYDFEERERRVNALMIERAVLKARAERTNAMAQMANPFRRLVTGLAATIWGWGRNAFQQVRWTLPSPRKL